MHSIDLTLRLANNRREFGGFTYKPTVKAAPFGVRPAFITVAILAKEKAADGPRRKLDRFTMKTVKPRHFYARAREPGQRRRGAADGATAREGLAPAAL